MRWVFVFGNALLLAALLVYCLVSGDAYWKVLTGLAVGNIVSAANIYITGTLATLLLKKKKSKQASFSGNMYYALRYIGMFVVLAGAMALDVVNLVALMLPLFFPKIHYFLHYSSKNPDDLL